MSLHLNPSARTSTPGLPATVGPATTDAVSDVGRQAPDAGTIPASPPGIGPAGELNRGLMQDAIGVMAKLNGRINALPADAGAAVIREGARALLDAADCLMTTGADNPSGLSVEDLASLRDQSAVLQKTAMALKSMHAGMRQAGVAGLSATEVRERKAIAGELIDVVQKVSSALRASQREFSGTGPQAATIWTASDGVALTRDLIGSDAPTPSAAVPADPILRAVANWEHVNRGNVRDALARLPSAMLLSTTDRTFVQLQYDTVRGELASVKAAADTLRAAGQLSPDAAMKLDHFIATLRDAMCSLQSVLDVVEEYRSPASVQNICSAKMVEIDAALAVLASEPGKHDGLARALADRRIAFARLRDNPGSTDAARLLGKPAVSGPARLLHPIDAIRQQLRVDKAVARIFANPTLIHQQETLETVHFSETQLLARMLKGVGIADANKRLSTAIGQVLNQRPWDVINSRIVIPVAIGSGDDAQPVMTVTSNATVAPAGTVLNDTKRIQFLSGRSAITADTVKEYQHTAANGSKVSGGFNSHDTTEATHAVMAAHTELSMNGKVLLGATRTGVNAPYELDGEHLRAMPVADAAQLIRKVIGESQREAIRVQLGGAPVTADGTTDANPALRANPLRADFVRELGDGADALLAAGGDNDALVQRVAGNTVLAGLVVRQAALNRVREAFMVELTRSPAFTAQIAAGEPISFMSLSLLTPDAMRASLASHSPSLKEFDEKAMLEIQVRAWQDLQAEIDGGGIVVNGKAVQANILAFNFGVNAGAVGGIARNPVLGEAVSGTAFANQLTNAAAMERLIGTSFAGSASGAADASGTASNAVDRYLTRQDAALAALQAERNPSADTAAQIARIHRDKSIVNQLRAQIAEIWISGSYTVAGNEPYKLVSRLLVLHHMIDGGSQFNCKSGKDRTGQLDVEAKFLAFQIENNGGHVPRPDRERGTLERLQFSAIVFQDEARRTMQAYATGYGGSKLAGVPSLYRNFLIDLQGHKDAAKRVIAEFMGLAHFTKA